MSDDGGTVIAQPVLLQLREDINELRIKTRALEAQLRDLEQSHNELDDRQDEHDHRLTGLETVQERLLRGVTHGNLVAERTEKHLLAVMAHLHVAEPEAA